MYNYQTSKAKAQKGPLPSGRTPSRSTSNMASDPWVLVRLPKELLSHLLTGLTQENLPHIKPSYIYILKKLLKVSMAHYSYIHITHKRITH